ncbi:hypothetical protein, partial [Kitasatospora sp. NPDC004272]
AAAPAGPPPGAGRRPAGSHRAWNEGVPVGRRVLMVGQDVVVARPDGTALPLGARGTITDSVVHRAQRRLLLVIQSSATGHCHIAYSDEVDPVDPV